MADEIPGQLSFDLGLEADEAEAHTDRLEREPQLAQIRAHNATLVKELMQLGRRPDPAGVIMTRLDTLLEIVLGSDTPARAEFELAFEHAMSAVLAQLIGQARQLSLLAPPAHDKPPATNGKPPFGGGLIIPG